MTEAARRGVTEVVSMNDLVRVVQTCSCYPSEWNAWRKDGQYLYLRYRQGIGSVTAYPSPDYELWDPRVRPLVEWDDETGEGAIDLADFLAAAGMRFTSRGWVARVLDWLRGLSRWR